MARIGYARVSTFEQDHSLQEIRLRAAGCDLVRAEKVSGKSRDDRDELARILDFIRTGDELVVVKLDRLGRSTRDVLNLVHELEAKGASLAVLEPAFSTKDPAGSLLVTVLGMVAEMERKFIWERQHAGIQAAKAKGVYRGRKRTVDRDRVWDLLFHKHGHTAIAKELGISRTHVHRIIAEQHAALSRRPAGDDHSLQSRRARLSRGQATFELLSAMTLGDDTEAGKGPSSAE